MLAALIAIPINGFVISLTWSWFVVPIFGIRELGIAESVGLAIFISVLASPYMRGRRDDPKIIANDTFAKATAKIFGIVFGGYVIAPLLTLCGAWIWHAFFMSAE